MLRIFDVIFAAAGLIGLSPVLLILYVMGLRDTGSPIFKQMRVGRNEDLFTLVKFRSMKLDTADVATHLADASMITPFGQFLRRSKLDELPQLWNVLRGEMSLVGPRPCLPTQTELIAERKERGVMTARPGITGLAQIKGIDMSEPRLLAITDATMLAGLSVRTYFQYIMLTVLGHGAGDRVNTDKPK